MRIMVETNSRTVRDVAGFLSVGALLAVIHFAVPAGLQTRLAFDHAQVAPWSLVSAAYVHHSTEHLLENVAGFLVGGVIAHQLCTLQERRRWFWLSTIVLLLVVPVLVHITSYGVFQQLGIAPTSRGFSSVVAAFVGFVLVAVARWVSDRYSLDVGIHAGSGLLLVLLAVLLVTYSGPPSLLETVLFLAGVLLTFGTIGWRGLQREWSAHEVRTVLGEFAFISLVGLLLILFARAMFPGSITQNGTTTNIIAHAAGFGWGVATTVATAYFTE